MDQLRVRRPVRAKAQAALPMSDRRKPSPPQNNIGREKFAPYIVLFGSSQTPIGRRTHKSATNTSDQMVSELVARRSKRPAYPLNTPCVFRATPKMGITTIGQRPQATENVAQPRQRGCFQKRRAMTNKPKHMAFTITTRKTV